MRTFCFHCNSSKCNLHPSNFPATTNVTYQHYNEHHTTQETQTTTANHTGNYSNSINIWFRCIKRRACLSEPAESMEIWKPPHGLISCIGLRGNGLIAAMALCENFNFQFLMHFASEKMKNMSSLKNMPRPWRCWASLHPWWSRPANPPLDNSSNSILTRSCSTYVLFISFYHIFAYILQLHVWCRLMSNLLLIFHKVQFLYDLGWALTTEKRVFDRTETEKMCETLEVSIAKMCKGRSNLCFSIVLDVDPLRAAAMGWSLNFFLRVSKSPSMTYWTRLFKQ